jgi:hypothetical protein
MLGFAFSHCVAHALVACADPGRDVLDRLTVHHGRKPVGDLNAIILGN